MWLVDKTAVTHGTLTAADGSYRFGGLPVGVASLRAQDSAGQGLAVLSATLSGPDGYDNPLPELILDTAPPRIEMAFPEPGSDGISRSSSVEITFSELLDPTVLPALAPAMFSITSS